ncbi:MAG TPA: hypothetical protein VK438_06390 [Xanthobacteraceae bacterium]|nr:hypothetical protein [Xanthobacteraceae bacterium]
MIDDLLATLREEYRRALTVTICAAIIAAAATMAILFAGVALFIWMADRYGTVPACLAMAGLFVVLGGIAALTLAAVQSAAQERAERRAAERKRAKEEAAKNAPPAWLDPALIPTLLPIGIKLARIALRHRALVLALVSSAAVGWAMLRERGAPDDERPAAEQPAE